MTPNDDRVVNFHTMWIVPEWIRAHCVVPDGHQAGEPYDPVEWQEWFLLNHYRVRSNAPLPTPERPGIGAPAFYYRRSQIVTPQKALAVETPVATPSGWSTMAELRVGDSVFDMHGQPTRVVGKSQVFREDAYAVRFSDDSELIAGPDHVWIVRTDAVPAYFMRLDTLTVRAVLAVGWCETPCGRRIVSIEPVGVRETQCITVESATSSFLAGREMIVTGNSGKGPLSAAQISLEAVGPAQFAGWAEAGDAYDCADHGCRCGWGYEYEPGEPMGTPWPTPLIQVTAFSVEQAANVYDAFKSMVDLGPLGDVLDKPAEDFARLPNGGRIDRVTSSQQSRLGQRVTFVMQDEALALDTPIRTPQGWSTMGALRVGDQVMGSGGQWVNVTKATPVQLGRTCYRVTFPDRTSVVASDGHLWTSLDSMGCVDVRTTGGMFECGGRFHVPVVRTERDRRGCWAAISIERAPSVPARCIAVDSDDRLFVAGESCYLTHNTGIWLAQNKMDKVATTQRRGASGMQGRSVETTNAWNPSEQSVAQKTYEASLRVKDIFRIHPQAPGHLSFTNKAERLQILRHVYKGSHWIDLGSINAEAEEIMISDPAQAERFYGNRIVAGLGQWMSDVTWDKALSDRGLPPPGTPVAVGFDGSDNDDWTAIRCETMDGYRFTPTYGPDDLPTYWNPAEWGGSIPRGEVNAAVDAIASRYVMRRLYADPRDWQSEIGDWALRYGDEVVFEWATYRIAQMHMALTQSHNDYVNGLSTHDACPITREHVIHARKAAKPGDRYILVKAAQHQKIDMAMADTLAHVAAYDLKSRRLWEEPQKKGLTRVKGRTKLR